MTEPSRPILRYLGPRAPWQVANALRCSCRGADDMCPCQNDPDQFAPRQSSSEIIAALTAENQRLREALTPSAETKAAYSGEFRFSVSGINRYGEEHSTYFTVPWTTIKEIMAAIRERAALSLLEPK